MMQGETTYMRCISDALEEYRGEKNNWQGFAWNYLNPELFALMDGYGGYQEGIKHANESGKIWV